MQKLECENIVYSVYEKKKKMQRPLVTESKVELRLADPENGNAELKKRVL